MSKDTSKSTGKDTGKVTPPSWAPLAKQVMKERGLTQNDLCKPLGVTTRSAVGHYFTGRRELSADQATALADTLGLTLDAILRDHSDDHRTREEFSAYHVTRLGIPAINADQAKAWAPTGKPYPDSFSERVQTSHNLGPRAYMLMVTDESLGHYAPIGTRLFIDPDAPLIHDMIVAYYLIKENSFIVGKYYELPGRKFIVLPGYDEKYALSDEDIPCGSVIVQELIHSPDQQ